MSNGLTFEIRYIIFQDSAEIWLLRNFMKIGWQLTEKSTKNMRSWLITFNVTLGIVHDAHLKHTTTLSFLSDHDIISREWRVFVDQVQTNYHVSQARPNCWLWGIFIMVGCVLSQLKPSELYILSFEKASAFFKAKNVELLGVYPIQN